MSWGSASNSNRTRRSPSRLGSPVRETGGGLAAGGVGDEGRAHEHLAEETGGDRLGRLLALLLDDAPLDVELAEDRVPDALGLHEAEELELVGRKADDVHRLGGARPGVEAGAADVAVDKVDLVL